MPVRITIAIYSPGVARSHHAKQAEDYRPAGACIIARGASAVVGCQCTCDHECPKNDTLRTRQIYISRRTGAERTGPSGVALVGDVLDGVAHASNSRCYRRPGPLAG